MVFQPDQDHLDQHFLIDRKLEARFLKEASLKESDVVIEIGPGLGNITKLVAASVKKLYSIEIDLRLKKDLETLAKKHSNLELIFANVLKIKLPKANKLISALPYSIIEPLMNKLVYEEIDEIFLITGKNFANKLKDNNTKLAILVNSYYQVEELEEITPEAFKPKPRVLSSMIRLRTKTNPSRIDLIMREIFFYKYKLLKNAIIEALVEVDQLTKREAKEKLLSLEINYLDKKIDNLSNLEYENLYTKLQMMK